jgi:hypothetical protein
MNAWRTAHVEALRLARALQSAAAVFRRYAGTVKYHPQSGVVDSIGPDLRRTAEAVRGHLAAITALGARWDEEIMWLRKVDPALSLDDIQRGHAAAREAVGLLRAALDVFDRIIAQPEAARLDAPYGTSAPRRVHPGAQCTWVAERADALARGLVGVTLSKENLLLNAQSR